MSDNSIRPEITLDLTPAPARLATHTTAIVADVDVSGTEVASGRLVVLFEPEYQPAWDGNIRCVAYIRSELEPEMVTDPLLLEVGWSWMTDALTERGVEVSNLSGTVSRAGSQSFGDISERDPEGSIEIRSSWTVQDNDIAAHVRAWCDVLSLTAGLAPLTDGVVSISTPGKR